MRSSSSFLQMCSLLQVSVGEELHCLLPFTFPSTSGTRSPARAPRRVWCCGGWRRSFTSPLLEKQVRYEALRLIDFSDGCEQRSCGLLGECPHPQHRSPTPSSRCWMQSFLGLREMLLEEQHSTPPTDSCSGAPHLIYIYI